MGGRTDPNYRKASLLLNKLPCLGGATLHSMMTPHGPDAECFEQWTQKELGPIKVILFV